MIALKEAVIVEGRYDKIKLSGLLSTPVIETGGFRVFSDREKQALIRQIAASRGILVLTDSDGRLFGAHILGAHAADLIHECALLMSLGGTFAQLQNTIHAHPTLSEVLIS